MDVVEKSWASRVDNEPVKQAIRENVKSLDIKPLLRDPTTSPFLGYPIRLLDSPHNESESFLEFETPRFLD